MKNKIVLYVEGKVKAVSHYLLILILIALALSLVRNILQIRSVNEKISQAEEGVEELKQEGKQLEAEIESLGSDEYIEKQLREKLGLAKEGEIVLVLPDEDTLRKLAPKRVVEEDVLPEPNWRKWVRLFF